LSMTISFAASRSFLQSINRALPLLPSIHSISPFIFCPYSCAFVPHHHHHFASGGCRFCSAPGVIESILWLCPFSNFFRTLDLYFRLARQSDQRGQRRLCICINLFSHYFP